MIKDETEKIQFKKNMEKQSVNSTNPRFGIIKLR